ncbi:RHS repeat-associated core domain-containing protein [Pseudomonas putida]|uniref:RHS repeat-associated core domain-containing protein n=1 Tax=Pseudomonas putida TaxID=303 RepID=UPI0009BFDD97|nr:RHS repeat-associated core domain-containing protein [Pseudomonas putida]
MLNPRSQRHGVIKMLFSYNNNALTTLLHDNHSASISRAHERALFFTRKQSGNSLSCLLARDVKGSAIGLLSTQGLAPTAFSPWGHAKAATGLLAGFKGEYLDPVTTCYLLGNGYRSYTPTLMRFASPDSLSPLGAGGINAYSYLSGDPVNANDPTGHVKGKVLLREPNLGVFSSTKGLAKTKTLNIYAHGTELAKLGVDGLHDHLRAQTIKFESYDNIHVISCNFGNPTPDGKPSLAQRLSNKTQKTVNAYIGTVSTIPKPKQDKQYTEIKILKDNIYKNPDFNYAPVTVRPMIETNSSIRSDA